MWVPWTPDVGRYEEAWSSDGDWDEDAPWEEDPPLGHTLRTALSTLEYWADRVERIIQGTSPVPLASRSLTDPEILELCADTWEGDCPWVLDPGVLDTPDPRFHERVAWARACTPVRHGPIQLVLGSTRGRHYHNFRTQLLSIACDMGGQLLVRTPEGPLTTTPR